MMDMKEEMMNDAMDNAMEDNDEEEEEMIVNQVLDEIGIGINHKVHFYFIFSWLNLLCRFLLQKNQ